MKMFWAMDAVEDREAIYDYIEADNPAAAQAMDVLFSEAAARLLEHPDLGRPGRVADTREWLVHTNYVLIYDQSDDRIRILRILHSARQWPSR